MNNMKDKFYNLDYIPNKLVYVYKVKEGVIYFLAFINEGEGMKAIKHNISIKLKRDFKRSVHKFNPDSNIFHLIKTIT